MNKSQPTRRRVDAARTQRDNGNRVRDWIQRHQAELEKRREKKAREKREADADRLSEQSRPTIWVHKHARESRRFRTYTGRRVKGSGNTPYVNPARDARSAKAGRLRKELLP